MKILSIQLNTCNKMLFCGSFEYEGTCSEHCRKNAPSRYAQLRLGGFQCLKLFPMSAWANIQDGAKPFASAERRKLHGSKITPAVYITRYVYIVVAEGLGRSIIWLKLRILDFSPVSSSSAMNHNGFFSKQRRKYSVNVHRKNGRCNSNLLIKMSKMKKKSIVFI